MAATGRCYKYGGTTKNSYIFIMFNMRSLAVARLTDGFSCKLCKL